MVKSNLAYKAQDTVVPEVVVNESPIKWCAVALSDVIARGKRLEASVLRRASILRASSVEQAEWHRRMFAVDLSAYG